MHDTECRIHDSGCRMQGPRCEIPYFKILYRVLRMKSLVSGKPEEDDCPGWKPDSIEKVEKFDLDF